LRAGVASGKAGREIVSNFLARRLASSRAPAAERGALGFGDGVAKTDHSEEKGDSESERIDD